MTGGPQRLLAGIAALAGVAIVCLMTLTVLDIAGRNLRLYYLVGVIEISTLTMVLMAYFAFSHTFVEDGISRSICSRLVCPTARTPASTPYGWSWPACSLPCWPGRCSSTGWSCTKPASAPPTWSGRLSSSPSRHSLESS